MKHFMQRTSLVFMLYQTIPQVSAWHIEHGPWARNFLFIKFLTLTHSSSPFGPHSILPPAARALSLPHPLLIASPSGRCGSAGHAANVDMGEGCVASDTPLMAVRMPLQDVGYLGWRETDLRYIGCATGEMH